MSKNFFSLFLSLILSMFAANAYDGQDTLKNNFIYYINYVKQLFSPLPQEKKTKQEPEKPTFLTSKKLTEIAERPPVAFYNYKTKILILKKDISDLTSAKAEYSSRREPFAEVTRYAFSPSKRYIILDCDTKHTTSNRTIGRLIPMLQGTQKINFLIDAQSLQTIASFNGALVMHQFSPSEKTVILAGTELGGTMEYIQEFLGIEKLSVKGSAKNAEGLPLREESETGEILKYYLFDIASNRMIRSFQNIQAIIFYKEDELHITYDNNTSEKVSIIRNAQPSLSVRLGNFLQKKPNISVQVKRIPYEATFKVMYDLATGTIKTTIKGNEMGTFKNAVSYVFSPQNKFLLINAIEKSMTQEYIHTWAGTSSIKTTLLNVESGKKLQTFTNIITYEFNADETRLLTLSVQEESILSSEKQFYQLIDLSLGDIITTFPDNIKTVFFDSSNLLVAIDVDDNKIQYNPITGKSITEEKERAQEEIEKQKKLVEEKQKKENDERARLEAEERRKKEEKEKKLEDEERQKALEQAEEQQKQIEEQEKQWQSAYESEIPQQPQGSFVGWLKSFVPGSITEEKKDLQQAQEPQTKVEIEKKESLAADQEPGTEFEGEMFFDVPEKEDDNEEPSIQPIQENRDNNNS